MMTIPFYCVFAAFILIYLAKIPVGMSMAKLGGYDNRNARDQQAKLTGAGKRALAAHLNSFEGFPIFAAAVIIAHLKGANPDTSSTLAILYVVSRVAYIAAYVGDRPTLRSSVWFVGMLAIGGLFFIK